MRDRASPRMISGTPTMWRPPGIPGKGGSSWVMASPATTSATAVRFHARKVRSLAKVKRASGSVPPSCLLSSRIACLADPEHQYAGVLAGAEQLVAGVLRPRGDVGQRAAVGGEHLENLAGLQQPHLLGGRQYGHRAQQVPGVDHPVLVDVLLHVVATSQPRPGRLASILGAVIELRYRRAGVDSEVRTRPCTRFRPPDLRGSSARRPLWHATVLLRLTTSVELYQCSSRAELWGTRCGATRRDSTSGRRQPKPLVELTRLRSRRQVEAAEAIDGDVPGHGTFSFFVGPRTIPAAGLPRIEVR